MINALVYAMAEKFDIRSLKLLAKEKFEKGSRGWPIPYFPAVVEAVLTTTPSSDQGLRGIVRSIIVLHLQEVTGAVEGGAMTQIKRDVSRSQWHAVLDGEGEFLYQVNNLRPFAGFFKGQKHVTFAPYALGHCCWFEESTTNTSLHLGAHDGCCRRYQPVGTA